MLMCFSSLYLTKKMLIVTYFFFLFECQAENTAMKISDQICMFGLIELNQVASLILFLLVLPCYTR